MGLEALPARWHLLSSGSSPHPCPSRPASLLLDAVVDCPRKPITRCSSDASNYCGPHGPASRRHLASHRASLDGGPPPSGFASRGGPGRNEKGDLNGGPSSSSLRRTESSWSGQGYPEKGGTTGLFRWKSDAGGLIRRATRFEDFPGDRWRRQDHGFCEAENSAYQGFERLELDVVNPSSIQQGTGRSGLSRSDSARYESQGSTIGDREAGTIGDREAGTSGAEVSAVDVIAPSFVKDRQFMDSGGQSARGGVLSKRSDVNLVDQHMDRVSSVSRPASLKRKEVKVCTSGDNSMQVQQSVASSGTEKVPLGLGARAECLSIPVSLRNLRKRNGRGVGVDGGVCSIKKAFDSMVFMIRALQSYTLQLRQSLVSDVNVQHLMSMVHREMHSSFVWLFQQVFSCTPTLMVSVMILLADFAVFSIGSNVAMGAVMAPDPPTALVSTLQQKLERGGAADVRASGWSFARVDKFIDSFPPASTHDDFGRQGFGNYWPGGNGGRSVGVAVGEDGDYGGRGAPDRNAMFSEEDFDSMEFSAGRGNMSRPRDAVRALFPSKSSSTISSDKSDSTRAWTGSESQPAIEKVLQSSEQLRSYRLLLEHTVRELELKPGEPLHHVQLDQETLRILVAPLSTKMEADNYLCFDRTDLEYQHAITAEPLNPMLLANYAQFLYVVRHENTRAQAFFHRALKVDSEDGDILGRWASFLWLALKDRRRADTAYREAISLDPSNPFHAGSYAHFLWHAEDDEGLAGQPEPSF